MAKIIEVTPELLRTTASQIESLANDYKTQYDNFYKETNAMASTWSGKDNVAYINQIDGFKDDLQKMYTLMNDYADFLRKSAKAYDDTQTDVVNKAKSLQN